MRRLGSAGLTYTQVFLLVVGFGIASGLIFLFGMWVGRDIAERQLVQEERVVRQAVPVRPTAPEDLKEPDVDRAFYEKLKDKAVQRLQATGGPAASPTPTHMPQMATATRPRLALTLPTPTRPLPPVPTRIPKGSTPIVEPAAHAKPTRAPFADEEWADAGWTVQVNATTDPQQAYDLARTLKAKGYDAYTLQAPMRGQTWYRVRVGRFSNRERAKEIEAKLKDQEGLANAYVTPQ